jgi:hypothetical protein
MDKHENLETLDLESMDKVSGGCAQCQQQGADAGTAQSGQGMQQAGAIIQKVMGAIGGMQGG